MNFHLGQSLRSLRRSLLRQRELICRMCRCLKHSGGKYVMGAAGLTLCATLNCFINNYVYTTFGSEFGQVLLMSRAMFVQRHKLGLFTNRRTTPNQSPKSWPNFHRANIAPTYYRNFHRIRSRIKQLKKHTHLSQFFDFVAGLSDHASGLALVDHHTQVQFISVHSASVLQKPKKRD